MKHFLITGMSCAACQARVEKAVAALPGVKSVSVSLLTNSMGVEGDVSEAEVAAAVEKAGYGAMPRNSGKDHHASQNDALLEDTETPRLKRRLAWSLIFLAVLMYLTMGHGMFGFPIPKYFINNYLGLSITQLLLALAVMAINSRFFTSGFRSLVHGAPNMDTLVALGSTASFGWSLYVLYDMCGRITRGAPNPELQELYHVRLYFESAAMIPALITVGKLLEAFSKGKTTNALKGLLRMAPRSAVLLREGIEVEVPIDEVAKDDIFVVRPGNSIPVDGVVLSGESTVNESALTGESIPVDKSPGMAVTAATINQSGFLTCRATRVGEDTTLAQIIRMVSDAAATKAPIARIADRVSAIFVPAVIVIALAVIAGWLLSGQPIGFALARGIAVLVISCPCALGLATPVAIMVGNGLGAQHGILFKTGAALENAGRIQIVALDKTGTITSGEPKVTDLFPAKGHSKQELLTLAYALERKSEHPLAKAIVREAERQSLTFQEVTDFRALPGMGLRAKLGSATLAAGNEKLLKTQSLLPDEANILAKDLAAQGKTPIFFAQDNSLVGIIAVADTIKPDSATAVKQLHQLGIKTVMLTGDNPRTAQAIAKEADVEEVAAGILPGGKEALIRELQQKGTVAMVGDGINDAPALVRADLGIAIGAGTDVAVDSADLVLMNSSLVDVASAIRLSRKTLRIIHENLFWAFFYNVACIPLAAGLFGWKMNPMIAAAAMSLSSLTVCMNALRLNLFNLNRDADDHPGKNALPSGILLKNDIRQPTTTTMQITIKIDGMMCPHCEASVKKALEALPFIETATPNHQEGKAILTLKAEPDLALVKAAIEEKGYTFLGIAE